MVLKRQNKRAVGIFPSRRETEGALEDLRANNYPMNQVSVIARDSEAPGRIGDTEVNERVGNKAEEGGAAGAVTGGALGGLTGLLVGLGTLAIPGIGPIMLAGEIATTIATTLAGGAIGAATGGFVGALIGLGIPEDRARTYNDRISRGNYLVIVDGTDDQIRQAESILSHRGIEDWGVFDIPTSEQSARTQAPIVNNYEHRAIGVFARRRDAELALDELINTGFPPNQVYIIAQDYDHHPNRHDFTVHNRFDEGFFGFVGDRSPLFNHHFNQGEYLVVVEGTPEAVRSAETLFNRRGIQQWGTYKRSDTDQKYVLVTPMTSGDNRGTTAQKRGIGLFSNRREAEYALTELKNANFPMSQISVVTQDTSPMDRLPGVNRMNRVDNYASLGVFEDRAKRYDDRINHGDYLVMVSGTDQEIRQAQSILNTQKGIRDFDIYDSSEINRPLKNIAPQPTAVVNRDPKLTIVDHRDR